MQARIVSDIHSLTPKLMAALPEASRAAVAEVYAGAFTTMFLTASGIAALGLIAAIALKNVRLPFRA